MCGSPRTSGLSRNRASFVASGTTSSAPLATACAQNDTSRDVSRVSVPSRDLNHCRSWSTKVIVEIGVPQIRDASSVRSSNACSGAESRISYSRSASSRAASPDSNEIPTASAGDGDGDGDGGDGGDDDG